MQLEIRLDRARNVYSIVRREPGCALTQTDVVGVAACRELLKSIERELGATGWRKSAPPMFLFDTPTGEP